MFTDEFAEINTINVNIILHKYVLLALDTN